MIGQAGSFALAPRPSDGRAGRAGPIVCAVDDTRWADRTVEEARSLARALRSRLLVVSLAGCRSTERLLHVASAERAELLLVRAPPRTAFALARRARMFRELLRYAQCPVVAVPAATGANQRRCGNPPSVVCGVGAGPGSPAVTVAARLAGRLRLRPIAVHACDLSSRVALGSPAWAAEDPVEEEIRQGWLLLSRTVDELGERAEGRLVFDDPARALQAVSARTQSRIMVVGFRREAGPVRSTLCRSVSMQLAAAAVRPVVIVPSS